MVTPPTFLPAELISAICIYHFVLYYTFPPGVILKFFPRVGEFNSPDRAIFGENLQIEVLCLTV